MKIDLTLQEWKRILNELNIQIEREGRDKIFCLCPFHEDTNASFVVYINTNTFKCYSISCHKKGDIISLISLIKFNTEKGKFKESINWLSQIIPEAKLKKYVRIRNKKSNFEEIFESWVISNAKENIEKYKFLMMCKNQIKDLRLVKEASWALINPFVKTFDFVEKVYKEELLLVNFIGLGYYVFTKKGDMISKLINKYFNCYAFEECTGKFMISGKDFKQNNTPKEYKTITTVFYTENPIIYNVLKKDYKIAIGLIEENGVLNFPDNFFIFCFIVLDDCLTTIESRFKKLFLWHLDDKMYWFYKVLKINRKSFKEVLKAKYKDLIS